MKNAIVLTICLFFFLIFPTFAQPTCIGTDCGINQWQTVTHTFSPYPGTVNCTATLVYQWRPVVCGGNELFYELQVVEFSFGGSDCSTNSLQMMNYALFVILSDPNDHPPFPNYPDEDGECVSNYLITGPNCWEKVPLGYSTDPDHSWALRPCNGPLSCCRIYEICYHAGEGLVPNDPTYTQQSCAGMIGNVTHEPCMSWCE